MASTVLAGAVGYPGSSVAFAQLLSGMERSGLITREVRGKRTYRIAPAGPDPAGGTAQRPRSRSRSKAAVAHRTQHGTPVPAPMGRSARPRGAGPEPGGEFQRGGAAARAAAAAAPTGEPGAGAGDFDYDELARRLLVQVVRRLATGPSGRAEDTADTSDTEDTASGSAGTDDTSEAAVPRHPVEERTLRQTVASLEQKLASVQSRQRTLAEENERLREQLHEAERSLAQVQERASRPRVTDRLGTAEEALLQRLLSLAGASGHAGEETGTG